MFNPLELLNLGNKTLQVAVEYRAPHWMVLLKNPGQKTWEPVRSTTKNVIVQDEFGTNVKSYPAIQSFPTQEAAEQWIAANVKVHARKSRSKTELQGWLKAESRDNHAYQYTTAS